MTQLTIVSRPAMQTWGGVLALLLLARYLKDIVGYNKVEGKPFYRFEVLAKIQEVLAS